MLFFLLLSPLNCLPCFESGMCFHIHVNILEMVIELIPINKIIIMFLIHFSDWFQLALKDAFHCHLSHILTLWRRNFTFKF